MSGTLHDTQNERNEIGKGFGRYTIGSSDVVFHVEKEGKKHVCGFPWHSSASAFNHCDGGDDAVITGGSIIVNDACIHMCLTDYIIGKALKKDPLMAIFPLREPYWAL